MTRRAADAKADRLLAAAAGAVLVLCPASASAHLASTGLGPVYDGISHLFLSIDDLLPVLAMAMLAGLNAAPAARRAAFTLPIAWLIGGMIGMHAGLSGVPAGIAAPSLLVLGVLVAADLRVKPPAVTALATILGLLHGGLNGAEITQSGREASALLGIVGAVFVMSLLVAAAVVSVRVRWARIVVRIAGSWIAATGLLMLGWALSGRT